MHTKTAAKAGQLRKLKIIKSNEDIFFVAFIFVNLLTTKNDAIQSISVHPNTVSIADHTLIYCPISSIVFEGNHLKRIGMLAFSSCSFISKAIYYFNYIKPIRKLNKKTPVQFRLEQASQYFLFIFCNKLPNLIPIFIGI